MNALIAGYINIIRNNEWFIKNYEDKSQYKYMVDALKAQNIELEQLIEDEAKAMIEPEIDMTLTELSTNEWLDEMESIGTESLGFEGRFNIYKNGNAQYIAEDLEQENSWVFDEIKYINQKIEFHLNGDMIWWIETEHMEEINYLFEQAKNNVSTDRGQNEQSQQRL